MHFKHTPRQQKNDLNYYILEGATWAIMYYIGVIFLVPYLIKFNATTMEIGLINTLPIFLASFSVLFSYVFLKHFKSEKHFVLFFTALEAFFWVPLAFIGYISNNHLAVWLVILCYCLIMLCEQFPMGVYREWIGKVFNKSTIVENNAKKQIILNLVSIAPLLLAGVLLDTITTNAIFGFTIIFLIAGFFRFWSVVAMSKMSQTEDQETLKRDSKEKSKPVHKVFKDVVLKNKSFVYFLVVVSLIYFAMYIASPFYKYYFLEILHFSYKQYAFLEIGSILGLVLSYYYWGKVCDRYGSTKVLKAIILFLPAYPVLVMVFGNNAFLLFLLNVIDGTLMAGLTLSIFGYFYQNIKTDLVHHMSFFLIAQSTAMLLGAVVGGYIATNERFWFMGVEKYGLMLVFAISVLFRAFAIGFSGRIKDTNKSQINLPRSILLQKPIMFGLSEFLYFTRNKTRSISAEIKAERKELRARLNKQKREIEKSINALASKEKQIFEKITEIEKKNMKPKGRP